MQKLIYKKLFKPLNLNGLRLKNRITMAPLYLGYATEGGRMSKLLLHHYYEMAKSGAAMIMVENAAIVVTGSGSPRTIKGISFLHISCHCFTIMNFSIASSNTQFP